jgi:hypothetical protein
MPVRQDTFKLVPTTLVNTTRPRPPMTSKAAKKAYREANKLPKISKAEQRRIEAEEIARQKKEYEKEKAAGKAKVAREKKLKKEAEERAKRKELGLPEPSRFVRPSQPTIKTFVTSSAARKRSREEDNMAQEDADIRNEDHNQRQFEQRTDNPAKRITLGRQDEDDEFGDFPSLSQTDLPTLFAEPDDTSQMVSIKSSPSRSPCARPKLQSAQFTAAENVIVVDQAKVDTEMAQGQLLTEALHATTLASVHQCQSETSVPSSASSSHEGKTDTSAVSPFILPVLHALKPQTPTIQRCGPGKLADRKSIIMPPPAVPMTVNRLRSRVPLNEVSRNMAPPHRRSNVKPVTSTIKLGTKPEQGIGRQNFSIPPPSTLAFLESHLDEIFPSPSQQVRELLQDIDDMPSNTQVAREIDTKQAGNEAGPPIAPIPIPNTPSLMEEEPLHFLSSQDLETSSQDLSDIDTPSQPIQKNSLPHTIMDSHHGETEANPVPPPAPKLKPRFFEEKEDDLLYAALHESLLLSKQTTQGSSPRRSQRIFCRTQSVKTDHVDDYGSDGSDIDADLLALLDDA